MNKKGKSSLLSKVFLLAITKTLVPKEIEMKRSDFLSFFCLCLRAEKKGKKGKNLNGFSGR